MRQRSSKSHIAADQREILVSDARRKPFRAQNPPASALDPNARSPMFVAKELARIMRFPDPDEAKRCSIVYSGRYLK